MNEKPHTETSLADDLRAEAELARRRFVHATRPKGPMSVEEAIALHLRMEGNSVPESCVKPQ